MTIFACYFVNAVLFLSFKQKNRYNAIILCVLSHLVVFFFLTEVI